MTRKHPIIDRTSIVLIIPITWHVTSSQQSPDQTAGRQRDLGSEREIVEMNLRPKSRGRLQTRASRSHRSGDPPNPTKSWMVPNRTI